MNSTWGSCLSYVMRPVILSCFSLALLPFLSFATAHAAVQSVPTGSDPQVNGDNLQNAIYAAACGDTIVLQAGATYATRVTAVNSYGPQGYPFILPNKSCATGQYVTIQTSQISSLPAGRIGPANIGLMATLATNSNSWVIEAAQGAGNYQFIGIEFTNTSNVITNKGFNPTLVMASPQYIPYGNWSHDMVFDRVWIHPYDDVANPTGTTRSAAFAIRLDGANQTIKNSYISGFCCFQSDTPTVLAQSEGIAIPTGPGPITITNNFVEAFGWNIFTGGAGAFPNPANQTTISGATLTGATFANTANLLVGDYVALRVPPYTNTANISTIAYVVVVDSINLGLFQHDVNVLWDLAVHDLSIMDYVLSRVPLAVSATGLAHVPGQPENIAYMTMFFDGRLIAHVHVNWLAPVKVRRTVLGGSRRMILFDDLEASEKIKVYDRGISVNPSQENVYQMLIGYRTGDMWAPQIGITEALQTAAGHFVDCIENRKTPTTGGQAGLRVVRLLEAATLSLSRQGALVSLGASVTTEA